MLSVTRLAALRFALRGYEVSAVRREQHVWPWLLACIINPIKDRLLRGDCTRVTQFRAIGSRRGRFDVFHVVTDKAPNARFKQSGDAASIVNRILRLPRRAIKAQDEQVRRSGRPALGDCVCSDRLADVVECSPES